MPFPRHSLVACSPGLRRRGTDIVVAAALIVVAVTGNLSADDCNPPAKGAGIQQPPWVASPPTCGHCAILSPNGGH